MRRESIAFFGTPAQVSVEGTVNGQPFKGLAFPTADGTHFLNFNAKVRRRLAISECDRLEFRIRRRVAAEDPAVPPELARALAANRKPRFGGRTLNLDTAEQRCGSLPVPRAQR